MRDIRHFIWDLDGTLLDTYPGMINNLRLALNDFGYSCDTVEAMELMLQTVPIARNFYAEKYGIDPEALREAYFRHHNEFVAALGAEPMAGAREVLAQICAAGRHNYIFTHRKQAETEAFLEKYDLTDYFRDMVCPEHPNFAWKPAPDAVDYLVEKYQMDRSQAVMVGDRERDLESGRNAGIQTAHLICSLVPETLDCNYRLNKLTDMLTML